VVRDTVTAGLLYDSLEERLSEQQIRHAGCVLCRHLQGLGLLRHRASHRALDVAERYSRGEATLQELAAARTHAKSAAGKAGEECGEAEYHAAEAVGYLTAAPGDREELRGAVPWALHAAAHADLTEGVLDVLRRALPLPATEDPDPEPSAAPDTGRV
jgi:hypothetical protein